MARGKTSACEGGTVSYQEIEITALGSQHMLCTEDGKFYPLNRPHNVSCYNAQTFYLIAIQ